MELTEVASIHARRFLHRPVGRTAVLFSGGLDSLLSALRWPDADLLFIQTDVCYADLDKQRAKTLAEFLERPLVTITNPLSFAGFAGPVIPNRNLFLLATASAAGYRRVIVSHPIEDLVADSSPSFIAASSRVLSASLGEHVIVSNALRGETKTSALRKLFQTSGRGPAIETLVSATRSCYGDLEDHCGACAACFKRWVAFTNHRIEERWRENPAHYIGVLLSRRGTFAVRKWRYLLDVLRALRP